MATLNDDVWQAEAKRQRDTFGPGAEIPMSAHLRVGATTPVNSSGRIAELAQQVAEAAHMLQEARGEYRTAAQRKEKCEVAFAQVAGALLAAINEHREGTPEGVPYQPYDPRPLAHAGRGATEEG